VKGLGYGLGLRARDLGYRDINGFGLRGCLGRRVDIGDGDVAPAATALPAADWMTGAWLASGV